MSLNDEKDTNHLSDLDTVDLLFGDLIRVSKDGECFVAVDHLTHIAEVGSTEAEAVNIVPGDTLLNLEPPLPA